MLDCSIRAIEDDSCNTHNKHTANDTTLALSHQSRIVSFGTVCIRAPSYKTCGLNEVQLYVLEAYHSKQRCGEHNRSHSNTDASLRGQPLETHDQLHLDPHAKRVSIETPLKSRQF